MTKLELDLRFPSPNQHAKYGPSSMKRIMKCAPSIWMEQGLPDPEAKIWTKEGKLIHAIGEEYVAARLEVRLLNLDIKKLEKDFDCKSTPEMFTLAVGYANFIYEKIEPYLQFKHTWFIEKRVHLDKDRDCWGTADFIFLYRADDKLNIIICDLKSGEGVVVKDHWQTISYSLGAIKEFYNEKIPFGIVEAYIHQPRVEGELEPLVTTAEVLLRDAYPRIMNQIDLIEGWFKDDSITQEDLEKYQNPGSWCQFCKAKVICKAYGKQRSGNVIELFKKASKQMPLEKNGKPKKIEAEDFKGLIQKGIIPAEDLAFMALNASAIKNFVDLAPPITKVLLARGEKIPGVKVIETNGSRSFIPNLKKLKNSLIKIGITEPVRMVEKWITMTEAEKQVGKGTLDKLGLTVPGEKGTKLVPIDHPGQSVKFGLDTAKLFKEAICDNSEEESLEG